MLAIVAGARCGRASRAPSRAQSLSASTSPRAARRTAARFRQLSARTRASEIHLTPPMAIATMAAPAPSTVRGASTAPTASTADWPVHECVLLVLRDAECDESEFESLSNIGATFFENAVSGGGFVFVASLRRRREREKAISFSPRFCASRQWGAAWGGPSCSPPPPLARAPRAQSLSASTSPRAARRTAARFRQHSARTRATGPSMPIATTAAPAPSSNRLTAPTAPTARTAARACGGHRRPRGRRRRRRRRHRCRGRHPRARASASKQRRAPGCQTAIATTVALALSS